MRRRHREDALCICRLFSSARKRDLKSLKHEVKRFVAWGHGKFEKLADVFSLKSREHVHNPGRKVLRSTLYM